MAQKLSLLVLVLFTAAPAQAADHRVAARDNVFDPSSVTIAVGDTVTWAQAGTQPHNVRFDDGSFEEPREPTVTPWTASRRFDTPGTFRYYCEAHQTTMRGTVTVTGPPPAGDATAPSISELRASPARFCNRRACRKRGTRFKFTLSEDATLAGRIRPVGRPSGRRGETISTARSAGERSIRFVGPRLKPGRYRLSLTATDLAGNKSAPARTSFRVRRPR